MPKAAKYTKMYEKKMPGYPLLRKVFYIIKENQKPIYFRDIWIIYKKERCLLLPFILRKITE